MKTAQRIDGACFTDETIGGRITVEFWSLPGSIYRTEYNHGSTRLSRPEFVPTGSYAYGKLRMIADAEEQAAFYSI